MTDSGSDTSFKYRFLYDDCRARYGSDDDKTLEAKESLADVYLKQKRFNEASQLYDQIFRSYETILKKSSDVSFNDKGEPTSTFAILRQDRLNESFEKIESMYETLDEKETTSNDESDGRVSVEKKKSAGGEDLTAKNSGYDSSTSLTKKLLKEKNYDEALEILHNLWATYKNMYGAMDERTLDVRVKIGNILYKQGKHDECLHLFHEVYNYFAINFGANKPKTLKAKLMVAMIYMKIGDFKTSMKLYEELHSFYGKTYGKISLQTIIVDVLIGKNLLREGKIDKALEKYRSVHESYSKLLGPRHHDTVEIKHIIGHVLLQKGSVIEALVVFQDVFMTYIDLYGKNDVNTLECKASLASALLLLRKFDLSLQYFEEVYEQYKTLYGLSHMKTVSLKNVIDDLKKASKNALKSGHDSIQQFIDRYSSSNGSSAQNNEQNEKMKSSSNSSSKTSTHNRHSSLTRKHKIHRQKRDRVNANVGSLVDGLINTKLDTPINNIHEDHSKTTRNHSKPLEKKPSILSIFNNQDSSGFPLYSSSIDFGHKQQHRTRTRASNAKPACYKIKPVPRALSMENLVSTSETNMSYSTLDHKQYSYDRTRTKVSEMPGIRESDTAVDDTTSICNSDLVKSSSMSSLPTLRDSTPYKPLARSNSVSTLSSFSRVRQAPRNKFLVSSSATNHMKVPVKSGPDISSTNKMYGKQYRNDKRRSHLGGSDDVTDDSFFQLSNDSYRPFKRRSRRSSSAASDKLKKDYNLPLNNTKSKRHHRHRHKENKHEKEIDYHMKKIKEYKRKSKFNELKKKAAEGGGFDHSSSSEKSLTLEASMSTLKMDSSDESESDCSIRYSKVNNSSGLLETSTGEQKSRNYLENTFYSSNDNLIEGDTVPDDMNGKSFDFNISGKSLDLNVSGKSQDLNASGKSFALNPSAKSFDFDGGAAGKSFDLNQSGKSYDLNGTGRSYDLASSGRLHDISASGRSEHNNTTAKSFDLNSTGKLFDPNSSRRSFDLNATEKSLDHNNAAGKSYDLTETQSSLARNESFRLNMRERRLQNTAQVTQPLTGNMCSNCHSNSNLSYLRVNEMGRIHDSRTNFSSTNMPATNGCSCGSNPRYTNGNNAFSNYTQINYDKPAFINGESLKDSFLFNNPAANIVPPQEQFVYSAQMTNQINPNLIANQQIYPNQMTNHNYPNYTTNHMNQNQPTNSMNSLNPTNHMNPFGNLQTNSLYQNGMTQNEAQNIPQRKSVPSSPEKHIRFDPSINDEPNNRQNELKIGIPNGNSSSVSSNERTFQPNSSSLNNQTNPSDNSSNNNSTSNFGNNINNTNDIISGSNNDNNDSTNFDSTSKRTFNSKNTDQRSFVESGPKGEPIRPNRELPSEPTLPVAFNRENSFTRTSNSNSQNNSTSTTPKKSSQRYSSGNTSKTSLSESSSISNFFQLNDFHQHEQQSNLKSDSTSPTRSNTTTQSPFMSQTTHSSSVSLGNDNKQGDSDESSDRNIRSIRTFNKTAPKKPPRKFSANEHSEDQNEDQKSNNDSEDQNAIRYNGNNVYPMKPGSRIFSYGNHTNNKDTGGVSSNSDSSPFMANDYRAFSNTNSDSSPVRKPLQRSRDNLDTDEGFQDARLNEAMQQSKSSEASSGEFQKYIRPGFSFGEEEENRYPKFCPVSEEHKDSSGIGGSPSKASSDGSNASVTRRNSINLPKYTINTRSKPDDDNTPVRPKRPEMFANQNIKNRFEDEDNSENHHESRSGRRGRDELVNSYDSVDSSSPLTEKPLKRRVRTKKRSRSLSSVHILDETQTTNIEDTLEHNYNSSSNNSNCTVIENGGKTSFDSTFDTFSNVTDISSTNEQTARSKMEQERGYSITDGHAGKHGQFNFANRYFSATPKAKSHFENLSDESEPIELWDDNSSTPYMQKTELYKRMEEKYKLIDGGSHFKKKGTGKNKLFKIFCF